MKQTTRERARKELISAQKETSEQIELISRQFLDNPEPFFKEREKEVASVIETYGDLQNKDIQNGIISKKDYCLKLVEKCCKPILPRTGRTSLHNAMTLRFTNDFYWDKIVLPLIEKVNFIPNIYDLFTLLNISKSTFELYSQNGDEDMRETCEMIVDKFIGYYQRKGMSREISEIMSIFVLKTTYKQRENEGPHMIIANINTTSPKEKIDKLARQYGYEEWSENN